MAGELPAPSFQPSDVLTNPLETDTLRGRLVRTMKNFLQYLLMVFALCLCGLVAFQWDRETRLQQDQQRLTDTIQGRKQDIQNLEGTLKQTEDEVKRLDQVKTELTDTVKSNRLEILQLRKDQERADAEVEKELKQIDVYKTALEQANENIKKQNEDIRKQNEQLKQLADERNEAVVQHNKTVEEFNDLAKKWNDLQTTLAATNAPPPTKPPAKQ
jgi:chromosome segregation ATPase